MINDINLLNQFSIKLFLFALNITIKSTLIIIFLAIFLKFFKKIASNFKYFFWFFSIILIPIIMIITITLNSVNYKTNNYNIITNLNHGIISIYDNITNNSLKTAKINTIQDIINNNINTNISENPPKIHWSLIFLFIWSAGFFISIITFSVGHIKLFQFMNKVIKINNKSINKMINQFKHKFKIKKDIKVYTSNKCNVPATFHLFKNIIILPEYIIKWPKNKIEIALTHELMHIKHNDCITKNLARFVCTVFWFIPLIWYAYKKLKIEQENKCDLNIMKIGFNKFEYAYELLNFVKDYNAENLSFSGIFSFISKKNILEERIMNIINFKKDEIEKYIKNSWKIIYTFVLIIFPLLIINPFKTVTQKEILKKINKSFNKNGIIYNQLSEQYKKDIKDLPVLWPMINIEKVDKNILKYMNTIVNKTELEINTVNYKDYYENSFTNSNKEYLKNGVFIVDKENAPIVASADGIIEEIKSQNPWGIQIIIRHKNGLKSIYSYIYCLSDSIIKSNKKVYQGQIIGHPMNYYGKYQNQNFHISYFHYAVQSKSKIIDPCVYLYCAGERIYLANN